MKSITIIPEIIRLKAGQPLTPAAQQSDNTNTGHMAMCTKAGVAPTDGKGQHNGEAQLHQRPNNVLGNFDLVRRVEYASA